MLGRGSLLTISLALSRRFKDEQIDILVATDVAARGLDIEGVKTVRLVLILLLVGSLSCVDCSWWGPCASCACLGHLTDPRSDLQVINFTMPNTVKHYVHRVGRTARAGRAGRSVSLVGEEERKMLKEIVKAAKAPVKARILPQGEQHRMWGRVARLCHLLSPLDRPPPFPRKLCTTKNGDGRVQLVRTS